MLTTQKKFCHIFSSLFLFIGMSLSFVPASLGTAIGEAESTIDLSSFKVTTTNSLPKLHGSLTKKV